MAAVFGPEPEQVVVPARQQRGAQGRDGGQAVGRVVDRPQHHQQVADGPAGVDERAGLGPEGDPGLVQGVLQERQRRTRRDQDGDVAEPGRAPTALAVVDVPPFVDGPGHGGRHLGRLRRAQLVGLGTRGMGLAPQDRDRRPVLGPGSGR